MGERIFNSAEELKSSGECILWPCPDIQVGDTIDIYAYGHGPVKARVVAVHKRMHHLTHIRPFNGRESNPYIYEVSYVAPDGANIYDFINKFGDEFWRFPETLRTIQAAKPKGAYCSLKKPGCVVWNEYAEETDGKYHCYMCRGHYA